jgi:hypothetical protein
MSGAQTPLRKAGGAETALCVSRGVGVLRRLLNEETFDLREVDLDGFPEWIERHLVRWQGDPVFLQRRRICELRGGSRELRAAERRHRRAASAAAASPTSARLREVEEELVGNTKAIAGLKDALRQASERKRAGLAAKLEAFRARRRALLAKRRLLIRSPERQALAQAEEELERLRKLLGLDAAEAELARLLRARGRRGGRTGRSFEQTIEAAVLEVVTRDLIDSTGGGDGARITVLRHVRLGAAGVEFDLLVVRQPPRAGAPVEVLAAVEAKRNINDLAHGFRRRQLDLAWLTGATAEDDLAAYRTRTFPSGRFDRKVIHREGGEEFLFGPDSFREFNRDPATGLFLDRLYLVTRPGAVWGVSSAALQKIGHRVAITGWDPSDEACVRRLFHSCRKLCELLETPDVLRLFAEDVRRARSLLLVGPF